MQRINTSNAVPDLFGPGKSGFGAGNPSAGVRPTYFSADWCNQIQEEIANVIEGAGFALDGSRRDQLKSTISALLATALPLAGGKLTGDLSLDGPVNSQRIIQWTIANVVRWALTLDGASETGGNAGSNFNLLRYADNGAFLGAALSVSRATGVINFGVSPTGPTPGLGDNSTKFATTAALMAGLYQGKGCQVFIANGPFVAPAGVTTVYLSGAAAGGGGGGGSSATSGGAGGGAGGSVMRRAVTVVPGQSYPVTIGALGTGGSSGASGLNGGSTSFGALLTLGGGSSGSPASGGGAGGSVSGGTGGAAVSGQAGSQYNSYGSTSGGNGGASLFGVAGQAGFGTVSARAAFGFGAGGAGAPSSGNGGSDGSQGILMIEW